MVHAKKKQEKRTFIKIFIISLFVQNNQITFFSDTLPSLIHLHISIITCQLEKTSTTPLVNMTVKYCLLSLLVVEGLAGVRKVVQ